MKGPGKYKLVVIRLLRGGETNKAGVEQGWGQSRLGTRSGRSLREKYVRQSLVSELWAEVLIH
jgi:hypothetical protein